MPSGPSHSLPVEFGNAGAVDTHGTGWFIGFSNWSRLSPHDLRHMPDDVIARGLCVKWFAHRAGDPDGQDKPVSSGRTVSLLVSERSEFRVDFSATPAFDPTTRVSFTLRRAGDYVVWGPGIYHRAFGIADATILTVRWQPESMAAETDSRSRAPR